MKELVDFIRTRFNEEGFIPLHIPRFIGNEKKYLAECIDSTFVSSVGKFVDQFEEKIAEYVGTKYAVAAVNGTSALHVALHAVGVGRDSLVITQPLTFVATCNAIAYCGAQPLFVDVDQDTMGMSPISFKTFLEDNCEINSHKVCIHRSSGKEIKACVPMHTFGFPCKIEEIKTICDTWNIALVEDAAESLGSYVGKKSTGTFGKLGVFSFNGNKIITAGGGGVIVTDDEQIAKHIKHITTTAKEPHKWEYRHLEIGFNYRMPNVNAALLCAQLEQIQVLIEKKRQLAQDYRSFFENTEIDFQWENEDTTANYWLNTVRLKDREHREQFLTETNSSGIMTRPVWELMSELPMFENCDRSPLPNSEYLRDRLVNIPSSAIV